MIIKTASFKRTVQRHIKDHAKLMSIGTVGGAIGGASLTAMSMDNPSSGNIAAGAMGGGLLGTIGGGALAHKGAMIQDAIKQKSIPGLRAISNKTRKIRAKGAIELAQLQANLEGVKKRGAEMTSFLDSLNGDPDYLPKLEKFIKDRGGKWD